MSGWRVDSPERLFAALERSPVRYVLLRPHAGMLLDDRAVDDLDLLIEDDDLPAAIGTLGSLHSPRGLKVDLYGSGGGSGTGYHGHPHLPPLLARELLSARRLHACGAYVGPADRELLASLYHGVYHKAVQSGAHWTDPAMSSHSGYRKQIELAAAEAGLAVRASLREWHNTLVESGFGVTYPRLSAYIRHDLSRGRKVYFHARLMNTLPGEMNLYVIRRTAARAGLEARMLALLAERFEVLASAPVPGFTARRGIRRMRGGKWRRGGPPVRAVAVFDRAPADPSEAQRARHPHVFNANQFIKQHWREWFLERSAAPHSDNPIHSTDNEAEALGHLPSFFTPRQCRWIEAQLEAFRAGAGAGPGIDAGR